MTSSTGGIPFARGAHPTQKMEPDRCLHGRCMLLLCLESLQLPVGGGLGDRCGCGWVRGRRGAAPAVRGLRGCRVALGTTTPGAQPQTSCPPALRCRDGPGRTRAPRAGRGQTGAGPAFFASPCAPPRSRHAAVASSQPRAPLASFIHSTGSRVSRALCAPATSQTTPTRCWIPHFKLHDRAHHTAHDHLRQHATAMHV